MAYSSTIAEKHAKSAKFLADLSDLCIQFGIEIVGDDSDNTKIKMNICDLNDLTKIKGNIKFPHTVFPAFTKESLKTDSIEPDVTSRLEHFSNCLEVLCEKHDVKFNSKWQIEGVFMSCNFADIHIMQNPKLPPRTREINAYIKDWGLTAPKKWIFIKEDGSIEVADEDEEGSN